MSVINTMLRDLDARQDSLRAAMPVEVRATAGERRRIRPLVPLLAVLAGMLVVAVLQYWPRPAVGRMPSPPAIAPAAAEVQSLEEDSAQAIAVAPVKSDASMRDVVGTLHTLQLVDSLGNQPESRPEREIAVPPSRARETSFVKAPAAIPPAASLRPAIVAPAMPVSNAPEAIRVEPVVMSAQERMQLELQRATDLERRGAVQEAEQGLRDFLGVDREAHPVRAALAALLMRQQRLPEARRILREGLDLAPANAALLMPYARLLAAGGEWTAAREALMPATVSLAQDASYRALLAAVQQKLGAYADSSQNYQAALRLSPGVAAWWVGLGISLEGEGRPQDAREAYVQARNRGADAALMQFIDNKLAHM